MCKSRTISSAAILFAFMTVVFFASQSVMAQGKPNGAVKKEKTEKGERGRSDAARENAIQRGEGEKTGVRRERGEKGAKKRIRKSRSSKARKAKRVRKARKADEKS